MKIVFIFVIFLVFYAFNAVSTCADDKYEIIINIPSRTLELTKENKIEKIYHVGVGKPDFPTPVGDFKVITKIINPSWENPYKPAGIIGSGKSNPLGTRWIGFYKDKHGSEYGIHGTNNPLSVGKYCSHGCIRMRIKDAEKLFNKVNMNTPVKVTYYTNKLIVKHNKLIIYRYQHIYKRTIDPEKMITEQLNKIEGNYIIDQDKLEKAAKLKNGSSIVIGEVIQKFL